MAKNKDNQKKKSKKDKSAPARSPSDTTAQQTENKTGGKADN